METTEKNILKRTIVSYLLALVGFAAAVTADQATKWFAVTELKQNGPFTLIDGVFQLHYLENRGAAFGIMQGKQYIFIVGALAICCAVVYIYGRIPHESRYVPLRICAVLLTAGAVGNLIDRIRFDYVVDFFYFELIDFPIFNVADCYVVAACAVFVILILFYYKEEEDFRFLSRGKTEKEKQDAK